MLPLRQDEGGRAVGLAGSDGTASHVMQAVMSEQDRLQRTEGWGWGEE